MRTRRVSDSWLAAGILLVLFIVIGAGAMLSSDEEELPSLSSYSTGESGAKALYTLLDQLGYIPSNASPSEFSIPQGTGAVFLLEPDGAIPILTNEWLVLDQFVMDGGTLIAAGNGSGSVSVASYFGFSLTNGDTERAIHLFTPTYQSPDLSDTPINLFTYSYLERSTFDYTILLVADGDPYAVELPRGNGRVILVADDSLFTNAGLKEFGAANLLLNLLAPLPRGTQLWFDEWHHGERSAASRLSGPGDWLFYTPGGQGLLWILVVIFGGILLKSRYFGQPIKGEKTALRRAPLEYVLALARLNQRAGHRKEILREYHRQLKRSLSQRYRVDPNLPDEEFARGLAEIYPDIDPVDLSNLLRKLHSSHPSEEEMVELAHHATEWIQRIERPAGEVSPGKAR